MRSGKLLICNAALLVLLVIPVTALAEEALEAPATSPAAAEPQTPEPAMDLANAEALSASDVAAPEDTGATMEPEAGAATPTADVEEMAMDDAAVSPPASFDPSDAAEADDTPALAETPEAVPTLGAIGYDSEGRQGRIHVVVTGDTLWDISDAYLGTPWVWPSIWTDNRNIENPHVIHPKDHIWITDSEMRVVTPAEAEAMLAARPAAPEEYPAVEPETLEAPVEMAGVPDAQQYRRVSVREWVGLISEDQLEAAASIVKRIPSHVMLAQIDRVYIGLGEGDVQVGDQLDIIRDDAKVFDPETNRFLGYHVEALGWLEVVEVHDETSLAQIRQSTGAIGVGDKLLPRRPESLDIAIQQRGPDDVEGSIAFFPSSRVVIGPLDFVYLNRGSLDGLETGSPLEVVRGGDVVNERLTGELVGVPDRVVAKLLVVDAQPETAVALVAETDTDLEVGDTFRGASD